MVWNHTNLDMFEECNVAWRGKGKVEIKGEESQKKLAWLAHTCTLAGQKTEAGGSVHSLLGCPEQGGCSCGSGRTLVRHCVSAGSHKMKAPPAVSRGPLLENLVH